MIRLNAWSCMNNILVEEEIEFSELNEESDEGKQYLQAIKTESIDQLGYFLKRLNFSCHGREGQKRRLYSR